MGYAADARPIGRSTYLFLSFFFALGLRNRGKTPVVAVCTASFHRL